MNNLKLIQEESKVIDFINTLEEGYYSLKIVKRTKYGASRNGMLFNRVVKKKDILRNLKQLECYTEQNLNGTVASYISINPRCLTKAFKGSYERMTSLLLNNSFDEVNVNKIALSELSKYSIKNAPYFVIDIDTKEINLDSLNTILGATSFRVLETRGGYHIIINLHTLDSSISKTWYNNIIKKFDSLIDVKWDLHIPIPGTLQGDFVPTFC